ncbi:MAG: CHAT domain-containing protein [Planctomycetes bacterium]|nr:CHAT domain-containing protein [Planctomycetota bacterium]
MAGTLRGATLRPLVVAAAAAFGAAAVSAQEAAPEAAEPKEAAPAAEPAAESAPPKQEHVLDDPELRALIAQCKAALADPAAGLDTFQPLATQLTDVLYPPHFPSIAEIPALIEVLQREGRPIMLRAGGDYPLWFEFELAAAALQAGDITTTGRVISEALPQWPDDLGLLAIAAEQAILTGQWDAARRRLEHGTAVAEALGPAGEVERSPERCGFELAKIHFDVRLGRADRALLSLGELLQRKQLPPGVATGVLARKVDLYLLVDRADDALAALEAQAALEAPLAPNDPARALVGVNLEVTSWIAQAMRASPEDVDAPLLLEQLELAPKLAGISIAPALIARLAGADLAMRLGQPERARVAVDAFAAELPDRTVVSSLYRRLRAWSQAIEARLEQRSATESRTRSDGEAPHGSSSPTESASASAFATLLAEWEATPLLPGGISFLRIPEWRTVIHAALVDALDETEAFERLLAAQTMGSLARQLHLPAPTLSELRRDLLSSGELLLCWLPTSDATHLFVVDATRVRHLKLASLRVTRARVETLSTARDAQERRPHLAALADALLPEEVRAALAGARHAWLCGSELLEGVPLLELEVAPGVRLGAQLPVAELPSLPVALWLRRRPRAAREAGIDAWVGPETSLDGRARFTVDRERLAAELPSIRYVEALAGAGATEESLATSLGRALRADIGLFLAHGVIDRRRDRFAGLLLHDGTDPNRSVAWADAFEQASLPPFLVLGACSAGEAPNRIGEDGGEHLGGAALIGGARCVVLGRGTLDASETLPELVALLSGVEAGDPPATALWKARRARPADRPFVGLALIGLGDEPLREGAGRSATLNAAAIATSSTGTLGAAEPTSPNRRSSALTASALLLAGGGLLLLAARRRHSPR